MNESLATRVIALRKDKLWEQEKLATVSGVSRYVIAKIESGGTPTPRPVTLNLLSEALDTTPEFLMYGVLAGTATLDADVMTVAIRINKFVKNRTALIRAINAVIELIK